MAGPRAAESSANEQVRILERKDGYYWRDDETGAELGPFPTAAAAMADARSLDDEVDTEPSGDSLREAEDELGISDWIDPDTGEPAEGYSPHIEDH
ncbi:MAG: hypothetical protein WCF44_17935 [Candidatus Methylophosphatis roskildensis]|jgi:hypothetical protein|uniref:Uncharacterized protein n=1 Tax=Candidatus Methylophosphatis roskildensis TaxID=2899263 RepID=A0A9D7E9S4_9PROT|nr:hypothetical protein [Candidatus Methylophosphatis roskildensis]MBK7235496.1 hypothetical protein [Sterolibacteriaceae bacterium]MBK7663381.1 hypothetical protein [Sterolibacteriaceae bacterium]MBK9083721.1 hypothetical protein [Sterolibacteriaceae bacterium]